MKQQLVKPFKAQSITGGAEGFCTTSSRKTPVDTENLVRKLEITQLKLFLRRSLCRAMPRIKWGTINTPIKYEVWLVERSHA
ncbi:hypothetical protein CHS0354_008940 [Potamilus streckersoni]|uniref:Uncharacterized protein n=1 Tax=Potamilus streckersoni TaxID=2493646 RepID=A0AAE0THN6_9BIVA|nr:hypothetical protein CHS0354_008940 [Potamilus streckersoni]